MHEDVPEEAEQDDDRAEEGDWVVGVSQQMCTSP